MKQIAFLLAISIFLSPLYGQQTVGLFTQTAGSQDGYVLFAPIHSDTTYLIDKCGKKVHQWPATDVPGFSVYLMADGSLLRSGAVTNATFSAQGSAGGRLEKYDWDNNLIWSYTISTATEIQNHDIYPLPNGNILVAIWESYSAAQAIAAGRNPANLGTSLWSAKVQEIQPVGTNSANVIWEWKLWDHLIQDFDSTQSNYGVVANHPELLDLNFTGGNPTNADWIHLNSVAYNAALDQVMISAHALSEIYIIDHSTTTAEAATHSGGAHSKGGDILYRWGNPQVYDHGNPATKKLYTQHSAEWIPTGYPDGDKIMVFNNGTNRPGGNASSVDIISPPITASGDYTITAGQAYGPSAASWSYMDSIPTDFYSANMGGSQRLSNGNTLICEATKGHFFEVDSMKHIVWDYINPVGTTGPAAQGSPTTTNQSFRCTLYEPSYTGFSGQTLIASDPIERNPISYACTTSTGVPIVLDEKTSIIISNPFTDKIVLRSSVDLDNTSMILTDLTDRLIDKWTAITVPATSPSELPLHVYPADGLYLLTISNEKTSYPARIIHKCTK